MTLPIPGVTAAITWAEMLNAHINVAHEADGAIKDAAVSDVGDALYAEKAATETAIARIDTAVFDVRKYGAVGNGTTDDRAAFQLALNAIHANGGGTLLIPSGYTFKLGFRTGTYTSGFKVCCIAFGDDVTIDIQGELLVNDAPGTGYFIFANAPGVITPSNVDSSGSWWVTHNYVAPADGGGTYPTRTITAAAAGAKSVTLATPAQHSNFAVGDAVFIRSGQTLAIAGEGLPDAEINEITAINTTTGELTLKYPLAKPYVQEYFPDSGKDEVTTTTSTAWPALLGVQNIEPVVARNLRVIGKGRIDVNVAAYHGYAVAFGSVIGYDIDLTLTGTNCSAQTGGPYRHCDFTVDVDVAFNLQADVVLSADKGCGDGTMRARFINRGTNPGLLHLHEGAYGIEAWVQIVNPPLATNNHAIQIIGRSYDLTINEPDIVHNSSATGYCIYIADLTCQRTKILNPKRLVGANGISNGGYLTTLIGVKNQIDNYTPVAASPIYMDCTVEYTTSPTTFIMGQMPARSRIIFREVYKEIAFNGASSRVSVGVDGGYWGEFLENASLTGSVGIAAAASPAATANYAHGSGMIDVEVGLTIDGATAGKAKVTLGYIPAQVIPGV